MIKDFFNYLSNLISLKRQQSIYPTHLPLHKRRVPCPPVKPPKVTMECDISYSCKNSNTDKCLICNDNKALPKRTWNYETVRECWCCGNRNVVINSKCKNCGEIV